MLKFLMLPLLLVALMLPANLKPLESHAIPALPTLDEQHSTAHRIAVYDMIEHPGEEAGHCSGTSIGPHAILLAQHCFLDSNLVRLDKNTETTVIVAALLDGNDHVIYIVNTTFDRWARISQRKLSENEPVHMWGNPGRNADVWRDGFYVGMQTETLQKLRFFGLEVNIGKSVTLQHFLLPTFPGDSGSGVFDAAGNVVAVVTFGDQSSDNYDFPLQFTQAQLDMATK